MRILNESGLRICAHTINKLSVVERVKDAGADMIVSDFLYEDDMSLLEDNWYERDKYVQKNKKEF